MRLQLAKITEERAKEDRIKVEEEIAALVKTKDTGSKTVSAGDFKVTVTRGLNYKADIKEIDKIASENNFFAPVKVTTKRELDLKIYEWQRENAPDIFNTFCQHVTVTPKKISVAIKPTKK